MVDRVHSMHKIQSRMILVCLCLVSGCFHAARVELNNHDTPDSLKYLPAGFSRKVYPPLNGIIHLKCYLCEPGSSGIQRWMRVPKSEVKLYEYHIRRKVPASVSAPGRSSSMTFCLLKPKPTFQSHSLPPH